MQRELLGMMRALFGEMMLRTMLKDSAEIDNASARLMTVYELEQPVTSRETYQRCLTYLNGVNAEVETQIRLTWPSHAERLAGGRCHVAPPITPRPSCRPATRP